MNFVPEDRFMVFVRDISDCPPPPEAVEQEVDSCASYEEARRVQRAYSASARLCVIRYLGPAGGGD